ncbi:MAG TPA: hypothetical protein VJ770_14100 [Stellaceae bacterium]|nr:hypothetical protein [Stellaceae bacterium]
MVTDIAFALAGLGGFNEHGAGFLTAARDLGVVPDLVTATSGQIIVLGEWLRGTNLKAFLADPGRPSGPLGTLLTAYTGDPGIFRPAVPEYWRRWIGWPKTPAELAAALFPAQEYVPLRSTAYLGEIAALLNDAPFGVVFNAYDPSRGTAVLFGNRRAAGLWRNSSLAPITAEAIASALWLSLYGFEGLPGGLMDGAYQRPCLVAELHPFAKIFVARPLARGWRGKLPANWFEVQDWQYEMWFSAGYQAEVADMQRINRLIETGALKDPRYRRIELVEIAVDHPAGYFNYFTERPQVFDAAYRKAREALRLHL